MPEDFQRHGIAVGDADGDGFDDVYLCQPAGLPNKLLIRQPDGSAAEQARGQQTLDVRADIYSLGATLYHLVTGSLPFEGSTHEEVMAKQVLESLSGDTIRALRLSPQVHYFIEKMMAKDREIRYQDPQELMADIEDQISGKKTLDLADAPADDEDEAARARKRADRLGRKRRRKR